MGHIPKYKSLAYPDVLPHQPLVDFLCLLYSVLVNGLLLRVEEAAEVKHFFAIATLVKREY